MLLKHQTFPIFVFLVLKIKVSINTNSFCYYNKYDSAEINTVRARPVLNTNHISKYFSIEW